MRNSNASGKKQHTSNPHPHPHPPHRSTHINRNHHCEKEQNNRMGYITKYYAV